MTLKQLEVRALTVRSELRELSAVEGELDDEQRSRMAALTREAGDLDTRIAAAKMSEPESDEQEVAGAEQREQDGQWLELRSRAQAESGLGQILDAVTFGKSLRGATRELVQERGYADGEIPLEFLSDPLEQRAASTVTSGGDQETQQPTIPQVFPSMVAERMGVDRRMTGVGIQNQPTTTAPAGGPTATTAIGTSVADSAVTITGTQLTPKRLQVSAVMGRDELATFVGLDADVRRVLNEAITDGLDYQALRSSGGLFEVGTDPAAKTAATDFAGYLSEVYAGVDGRYASMMSELSVLVGPDVYADMAGKYRADENADNTLMVLDGMTRGVMTSANVADASSSDAEIVIHKGDAVGVVQAIWGAPTVISDPYSLSQDGQIRLTVVVMQDVATCRAAAYRRASVQIGS